jgi:hypothetical protein
MGQGSRSTWVRAPAIPGSGFQLYLGRVPALHGSGFQLYLGRVPALHGSGFQLYLGRVPALHGSGLLLYLGMEWGGGCRRMDLKGSQEVDGGVWEIGGVCKGMEVGGG